MKKIIRASVFETNSSSTHSISIMTKSDYEQWNSEKLYCNDGKIFTLDEAIEDVIKKLHPNYQVIDNGFIKFIEEEDLTVPKALELYDYYSHETYVTATKEFIGKDNIPMVAVSFEIES